MDNLDPRSKIKQSYIPGSTVSISFKTLQYDKAQWVDKSDIMLTLRVIV